MSRRSSSAGAGVAGDARASSEPVAEFRGISFRYGDGPVVLSDVDLEIRPGEVLTLLGASGCGKSTLLKMVAGLESPSDGTLLFQGEPVRGVNTRVGYMTQDDTLLPWRTIRGNLALPLRIRGVAKAEIPGKIEQALALVDLGHAAGKFPAQLSGGMKRRALLARSTITEPTMVLMDEPFAAIDADLREALHEEVRATTERLDQTVLFVTHDISEAALLSDRVAIVGGTPSATVREIVEMPFGRGRDLVALRSSTEFFDIQRRLREALSAAGGERR
ncbi:ATP-binding cassette domain-containing protein [Actinomadura sp. LD22]|uniref:ATP-binding cassette domain-containing protein n=1 Tax=Actinomadura physcomitrii TaxID=2650748 RepID=A0A6I4MCL9_9ACTN|nr:ABC transporter ATP-binding protein [Actinomadura physcomitrii]MWA02670.1 ATP-binding cassette domain-containing protein [Actinomadura physcomitrii]